MAGLPKCWSAEFQWFQWQLEETGKESWIKDSKRPQVQSTIPQPSLQDLCLTASCSDNSTTACENISLCWTIHSPGRFFLIFYLRLSCWSWSLSLALLEEGTRTHCASLHQPCTYLASCFVSAWSPLQTTHFSLSQPFLKSRFSTPPIVLSAPLRAFPSWAVSFPRYGNCSWANTPPLPSWMERLSHAFSSVPLWTGIPAGLLDFCSTGFLLYSQALQPQIFFHTVAAWPLAPHLVFEKLILTPLPGSATF